MKNKFKIVLKTYLTNTYKLKSMSKKKFILISILAIYLFASMFMMLTGWLSNIYENLTKVNMDIYYLTIIFALSSIVSFFFTIFSAKNALFENKDNDLLLSLPIAKKTILLSRLSNILIYNFIISLFIIIPGIYVYLTKASTSITIICNIIFLTMFSGVIPAIISSLFGYLIAFLTSKFKNKNIIELMSYTLFIGIYFLGIYNGDKLIKLFLDNPKLLTTILKYLFFPIYLINLSMIKNNFIYVIFYVLFNILTIYLFILLLDKIYYKLIVKLNVQKTSSRFSIKKINRNSPLKSLIKKELKRYFSSAIYVFNTSFGVVILLVGSIASLFYSSNELLSVIASDISLNSFMIVFYLMLFTISLSATTNSSISIERNNFWILKMLPVSPKMIFIAKKGVNLLLLVPATLISLSIFKISGYITMSELFFLIFISLLFSITIANFGLICNLLFPKFDAPNDTVIVKQSLAAMLGIMIPLVFIIIFVVIINSFELHQKTILLITSISILVLTIITNLILRIWGIKKYKKLG